MLQKAKVDFALTSDQIHEANSYVIRHMMIQKNANHMHWLDQSLLQLKHPDDLIVGIVHGYRLRCLLKTI